MAGMEGVKATVEYAARRNEMNPRPALIYFLCLNARRKGMVGIDARKEMRRLGLLAGTKNNSDVVLRTIQILQELKLGDDWLMVQRLLAEHPSTSDTPDWRNFK